jgi:osmotically-inducible protein OsmY
VGTYFPNNQPSKVKDVTIEEKSKTKLIGDGDLKAAQVDIAVVAGHVVLVGVVNQQATADKIVAYARATDGVVTVKSFLQLMGQ